jgi:HK97 gp10 family phage protein
MGVTGLESVLFNLDRAYLNYQDRIKIATAEVANEILNEAKTNAPVKYGKLRQSGLAEPINNGFGGKITFSVVYAPFVEFGTGGTVLIPSGWETFASQFKGKGIKTINLPPRPFLLPAFEKGVRDYRKKLEVISQTNIRL